MRILLVNPPIREQAPPYIFPLGLGYIASVLTEAGHNVDVLDINGYRYNHKQVHTKIEKSDFDIMGISGLITQYSYVKWLTKIVKQHRPKSRIIVGGGLASSIPDILLQKTDADIAVIGEGEITAKEIVNKLEAEENLADVKGICYKRGRKIIVNSPREPIKDLGILPFPTWDLFPIETYLINQGRMIARWQLGKRLYCKLKSKSKDGKLRSMNISAVRGCPYKCTYCYHTYYGYKVRFRPADSIIEEIKVLVDRYNVQFIEFADDIFVVNKRWVSEVCNRLLESGLQVKWCVAGRANLVNESLLRKMASAGCVWIGYGIESGSQKILNLMNKQVTVQQAKKAIEVTRKVNMNFGTTYMIGFPGETRETVRETVKFMIEMGIAGNFFYTTAYPGTPLYEWAKVHNKIDDEEGYFMRLSEIGEASELSINLTDFSDDELIHLKKKAEREALLKVFLRRLVENYRFEGVSGLIEKYMRMGPLGKIKL